MTQSKIINGQIRAGVWHGELDGAADAAPQVSVVHHGAEIAGVREQFDSARQTWQITVPIPPEAISDGLQSFVIRDAHDRVVGHFSILAGQDVPDDLRAEVSLLRAELDLLKAAFRSHCSNG